MAKFNQLNIELQDNQKLKLGTAEIWFDGNNRLVIDGDVTITGSVSGSSMSRCFAYLSSNQSIGSIDFYQVEFDAVQFDELGEFNISTHKFTASAEGYYTVTAQVEIESIDDGKYFTINIDINDSSSAVYHDEMGGGTTGRFSVTKLFHLNAGDLVHVDVRHSNTDPADLDIGGGQAYTFLAIHRLS